MKDKTSRIFELIAATVIGVYCLAMIAYAWVHPITTNVTGMKSYTFPVGLYILMLLCCVVLIIQNRITAAKQKKAYKLLVDSNVEINAEKKQEFFFQMPDKRVWFSIGAMILYAAMWKVVGFTISTIAFITCEAKILKQDEPLWKCILIAVIANLIIYLVFVKLFSISLPETFLKGII